MAENNILQGFELGLRLSGQRLERDLRMQELRSREAIRRVEEKNAADKLALELDKFQAEVGRQAKTALAAKKYQLLTSPDNPNKMLPGSAAIEAFMPIMDDPNQAANLVAAAGLANERAQGRAPTANMQEAEAISNLRQQIATTTDPAQKAALQTRLDDLMSVATPAGTTFETTLPDGTVTRMTTGRQPASPTGLTTAASTEVQKKSLSVDSALTRIDNALKNIQTHPRAIGPLGMARSAGERIKGWVGIEGEAPIAKARHDLALTFTELADSLRVDSGNMSLYERQKLESVGDPSRWQESAQTAQDMMENIQKAMIGRKLRLLRAEGKKPDEPFLRRIPSSEVAGLVRENLLSVEDAIRWHQMKR